jgi:inosine-uridine nucleoside N-ribohydrolase
MDVLIDTDPGLGTIGADPEDALAMTMALNSPELAVRAITCVHGNVPIDHSTANLTHLLELLGRTDIPSAAGHEFPLLAERREQQRRWLTERAGYQRVIPAAPQPYPEPRAVELILQTARASGHLTIVAIGPLTNIAAALLADPLFATRLDRVVIMGGAFEVPGNVTPTAEFNFFMDPEAAEIVLAAGLRPVLVGLDVCHQVRLSGTQLDATAPCGKLGRFVSRACAEWLPARGKTGPYLYDSLAVAAVIEPGLLTLEPALVAVETAGEASAGTSVAWLPGRPSAFSRPNAPDNALVATGVDSDRFDALFTQRVLARL